MLNLGFKDQIYDIYRYLPPELQVALVSATLPHEILEMTTKFMTDPVRILVKRDELTLEVGTPLSLAPFVTPWVPPFVTSLVTPLAASPPFSLTAPLPV